MIDIPVLHFQSIFSDFDAAAFRKTVFHLASDHSADDPLFTDVIDAFDQCFNGMSVTQNGNVVCYIAYFVDLMRDDDGRHALLFEFQKQIQQSTGVFLVQGRSRFIQDHKFCVLCQCFRDFNHLLFADTDVLDQCF